ncbi:MAG: hypothetical protein CVV27_11175 [Candidatus Melainabacteria bacterium HGW-Melainabacteria-1]|nr:MAG: hypothetical protein CVV27_11175 [Candidatus Melainabacteria bacterium HGW-Melainabacteria-1]
MGHEFEAIDADERDLISLLTRLNVVSQAQVTEALEYQCRLPRSQYLKLDAILIEMEYLSAEQLAQARQLMDFEQLPSQHELQHRLQNQTVQTEPVAAPLAADVPAEPVATTAPAAPSPPQMPGIKPPQLPAANPAGVRVTGAWANRSPHRSANNWSLPVAQAERPIPERPPLPRPADIASIALPIAIGNDATPQKGKLGEILLKNHDLEEWQLTHALCIQRAAPQSTPKLGTLLVRLGYVQAQAVERALSLQLNNP